MDLGLRDRVVLVTGASRGIGAEIARRFGSEGARVAVAYRSNETLAQQVAASVRCNGGQTLIVQVDVTQEASVTAMLDRIEREWRAVEVLVNNAGIARDGLLVRMSDDDWQQVIDANLTGAFRCTRAVIRSMMRQRWGRIINISSVAGLAGNAGQANYAAAKAGLIGLTRSVAKEVAARGITVNAVAPGFVDTDMTAGLSKEWRTQILSVTPVGRFGTPGDVGGIVAFLASDLAAYITGQVISVDGGLAMH